MIPSDLAARLRMLTEASFFDSEPPVSGPARVREIQARLPEIVPGQRFTATLERALPDGTFQAIVAGKHYTLALNHAAKSGDTLELIATQNTPKAVFAQLANVATAQTGADAATRPTLSATGRLIGFLLTGQPASTPAALAGGKPLLDAPPANGAATLAPALRQALTQSGLFYESHQRQWLGGKIDTAALQLEPQGQHAPTRDPAGNAPAAQQTATAGEPPSTPDSGSAAAGAMRAASGTVSNAQGIAAGAAAEIDEQADIRGTAAAPNPARAAAIPERLMPVVHQQLDAMATQNYVWHGQVWPGQNVEWEIEDPQRDQRGDSDEVAENWNTTLRLTLPRLGGMEAHLVVSPAGVALRLLADDPGTVAALDAARAGLDDALAAANLPLTGFVAERRDDEG
ncbi:flagellar hook-length control protein FliK [Aromatoleum anaerobium]|uniref:Flagellar hook-length control protein FliK n=1 Tax=Aromatoleum anaerobium TaxID=182180 RepID=A0ABX1PHT4_9RHOO|nr:flagellar hook-length control protein FliK [Aromatoleum anaerobium]MCK0509087.1 flagellar hook-length control protein FliK [Aromatoleum anaerobium]